MFNLLIKEFVDKSIDKMSKNFPAHFFSLSVRHKGYLFSLSRMSCSYLRETTSFFSYFAISPPQLQAQTPSISVSQAIVFVSVDGIAFEVFHSIFFFSSTHSQGAMHMFFLFHGTMQLNIVSTVQRRHCLLEVRPKPMFVTTIVHLHCLE